MLDEDGRRNVAGKAVFFSEVVDLLKVLHKWHLEEESVVWSHAMANFLLGPYSCRNFSEDIPRAIL